MTGEKLKTKDLYKNYSILSQQMITARDGPVLEVEDDTDKMTWLSDSEPPLYSPHFLYERNLTNQHGTHDTSVRIKAVHRPE